MLTISPILVSAFSFPLFGLVIFSVSTSFESPSRGYFFFLRILMTLTFGTSKTYNLSLFLKYNLFETIAELTVKRLVVR